MIDSNDLIHQGSDEERREFDAKVERQDEDVLKAAADRLGANVPEGASWQEYSDALAQYSWRDATEALEHASGGADYYNL